MGLDKTDIKIIKQLTENGRKSLRKIGKELKLSTVTIGNRFSKLKKEGIIKEFTANIDPQKVGYEITAITAIKANGKNLIDLQEKIAKHPRICGVYDVTGQFDSIVIGRFKNISAMNKFIKNILNTNWIQETQTFIALNTLKEDFRVKL